MAVEHQVWEPAAVEEHPAFVVGERPASDPAAGAGHLASAGVEPQAFDPELGHQVWAAAVEQVLLAFAVGERRVSVAVEPLAALEELQAFDLVVVGHLVLADLVAVERRA